MIDDATVAEDRELCFAHAEAAWDISRLIATAFIHLEAVDRRALSAMSAPVTTAQYHALAALDTVHGQTLGELAERLLCDKANASGIVDRLEAVHLVDRNRDLVDRRRVALSLTPEGEAALREANHRRTLALNAAFDSCDGEDLGILVQELNRLVRMLANATSADHHNVSDHGGAGSEHAS